MGKKLGSEKELLVRRQGREELVTTLQANQASQLRFNGFVQQSPKYPDTYGLTGCSQQSLRLAGSGSFE